MWRRPRRWGRGVTDLRGEALGIGVVGYGRVASRWQVPVYVRAGLKVVAICDRAEEARRRAAVDWPAIRRYRSYDKLLNDPAVQVVDLATRPVGRLPLIGRAIDAGRHVLAQKPLAFGTDGLAELSERAGRAGVVVAVNQNGRFAPAWRRATELLHDGAVGRIRAITHLYDTMVRWRPDMARHGTRQFLLFDYSNHWIDITGYWLRPESVIAVQAMDYDTVRHQDGSVQQSMWISMETESGANAIIRGAAAGVSHAGHQFLIQGDVGTLRGRVDSTDGEHLEWDDGESRKAIGLRGEWFPDGFLASMCELLEAVHTGRPPIHSLSDNPRTIALVAAVCASAHAGGRRVDPRSPAGWPTRA
jgi:predicted dehydrogenase